MRGYYRWVLSESKDNSVIEHLKKSYLEGAVMCTDAAVTHFSRGGDVWYCTGCTMTLFCLTLLWSQNDLIGC